MRVLLRVRMIQSMIMTIAVMIQAALVGRCVGRLRGNSHRVIGASMSNWTLMQIAIIFIRMTMIITTIIMIILSKTSSHDLLFSASPILSVAIV